MRALQARVRALQRILAKELAVIRLRRLSEEFCIESSVSQANGEPSSHPQAFMQRVASAGNCSELRGRNGRKSLEVV